MPKYDLMTFMRSNRAFNRAIHSLTHPLSILAIGLLLFNDHWLRWNHPSWLTGKLGDFTWLLFAPFVAALVFAWLIPRRVNQHEQIVGRVSFMTTGLWFGLAKTVPAVHTLTSIAWETLIGWQGSLRMDASDLLTLPALLIGWLIWQSTTRQSRSPRLAGSVILAFALVATLASDGPIYYWSASGIVRICQVGSSLMTTTDDRPLAEYKPSADGETYANPEAPDSYNITPQSNVFTSEDGGLTWAYRLEENFVLPEAACSDVQSDHVSDPSNDRIQYRWQAGESIERSTDGGATWTLDYALTELQQDVRRYYNHYSNDYGSYDGYTRTFIPGPVSGLVDQTTGNLVLAMSWDGVLVRNAADGMWHWVTLVGLENEYALANLHDFSLITQILFFELWLAGAIAFLVVTTSTVYIRQKSIGRIRKALLIIGWVAWFILTIVLLPGSKGKSTTLDIPWAELGLVSLPLLVFLALPLSVLAVWDIARNFRSVWKPIAGVAVVVAALFLFPFIPWMLGTIPPYTTALVFALVLLGAGLVWGYQYLRTVLPLLEKPKTADDLTDSDDSEQSLTVEG